MTWRKSTYSTGNGGSCVEVGIWRKSSYSNSNGGNCVEVGAAPWRKSTYSSSNGGACVETATVGKLVAVRDTKDNAQGPVLRFTPNAWTDFTATLK
ncbi:MAG TPA: DUF397 domain-containing protein [Trebonia sp.]|nr:DUF397 domain-containing protein [Trebonia sp.]